MKFINKKFLVYKAVYSKNEYIAGVQGYTKQENKKLPFGHEKLGNK